MSRDIEFNSPYFRFKSFTDDSENGQWTRVFSYTDPTNSKISFDITLGHEETVEKAQDLGSAGSTIYNYYQNLYDGTYVAAGSDPDSFLIGSKNSADADSWMPFSTKISLSEGTS